MAAWNGNAATPSENWNASADLNDDGYINVGDLQILIANWGQWEVLSVYDAALKALSIRAGWLV